MLKFISIGCALIGIFLFITQPISYSSWFSLTFCILGIVLALRSMKQEKNIIGNIALVSNIIVFIILILVLLVRILIWNRP